MGVRNGQSTGQMKNRMVRNTGGSQDRCRAVTLCKESEVEGVTDLQIICLDTL